MKSCLVSLLILLFAAPSHALFTELGLSYNYKKSTFDQFNNQEQQASTASLSFYFWEKLALELSYTNGLYVKKEKNTADTLAILRTTTQYTDVYGADLIFVLASRKAQFQPYLKGGGAYVKRRQVVQDEGANSWEIPYEGISPSYGVGAKIYLSEEFAIKMSYDVLQTPVDNNVKVDEVTGRVGISWML